MGRKYKAILFDMDGVVVNSMPFHYQSWKQIFESLGIRVNQIEIYKREGEKGIMTITEILEKNGIHLSVMERQKLLAAKERLFKEMASPQLFPGVESLIQDCQKSGYRLGLITGTSRGEIDYVLPSAVMDLFDVIITGDRVKHGKPAPEPYLKAIKDFKIKPADAVIIENAPYGIQSAKGAGIFCIAMTTSLPKEYLQDADIVCDSLDEVRELILGEGYGVKVTQ